MTTVKIMVEASRCNRLIRLISVPYPMLTPVNRVGAIVQQGSATPAVSRTESAESIHLAGPEGQPVLPQLQPQQKEHHSRFEDAGGARGFAAAGGAGRCLVRQSARRPAGKARADLPGAGCGQPEDRDLDVSLFDTALQNLCYLATWYLDAGHVQGREPRSAHPSLVPSQLYRTADGFIFIMCNKEKFWPILCQRIGRPEWADDPRFRSFKERLANRELVNGLLDEALSPRTTAEWLQHFAGQVPAAPVNDLRQAVDNPFVAERGRIADYGPVRMVTGPVVDRQAEAPRGAAPALGADTDAVLREHAFSEAEIVGLRADRVI